MTMNDDFVFVDQLVPGIRWDAKYATWDNFTGRPVDGYLANRIVGTRALCAALERVQAKAASLGFGVLLWVLAAALFAHRTATLDDDDSAALGVDEEKENAGLSQAGARS